MINEKNIWYLEGFLDSGKKWEIPLDKFPFTVGRNSDCSLTLSSNDISRTHAEISKLGSTLMLRDLSSTNGTYINNKQIKKSTSLLEGDTVHFGNIEFRIISKSNLSNKSFTKTRHSKAAGDREGFIEYYSLTNRETDVFYELIKGLSTKEIAKQLNISEGTAKNYVLSIFKKTNVHSRFELLTLYNSSKK